MKKRGSRQSLAGRMTLLTFAIILLSTSAVGIFSFVLYRGNTVKETANRAQAIAEAAAAVVDGEAAAHALATGEKSPSWDAERRFYDDMLLRTGVLYLYAVGATYGESVTYYHDAYVAEDDPTNYDLLDADLYENFADEMYEAMATGESRTTGLYQSGEYGQMVSGFAPIKNDAGRVIGVAGADIVIDDVLAASNRFGIFLIPIVLGFSLFFGFVILMTMQRTVGRPINRLAAASDQLAQGDMNVAIEVSSQDEIGNLAASFMTMIESTRHQVAVLERLAEGDLTARISPRGKNDAMGMAMLRMVDQLSAMVSEINRSTEQVSTGARQIAEGAESLAHGSNAQASAVEKLSSAIGKVSDQTRNNAALALKAASLAQQIRDGAEKSSVQMDRMIEAARDISEASRSIEQVMKVINDITSQTNILAINASVEAAHAGVHGSGFAVVANEVRTLAAQSGVAARDTSQLITNSIQKAELGARIAAETAQSLADIVAGIQQSSQIVGEIAASSAQQASDINEINAGIEQVTQVVLHNTATAQESAAASAHMRGQSHSLLDLMARFKLYGTQDTTPHPARRPPPASPETPRRHPPESGFGKY